RCRARSPAGALDPVPQPLQLDHERVAMVTLDLDHAVLDRTAGAAALLEPGGECRQLRRRQREAGNDRDPLPSSSLRFASDPDVAVTDHLVARRGTAALADRVAAVR